MEVASVADSSSVVKLCYSKNNNIASNPKYLFANKNDPRGNAECLRLREKEREVTTSDQTSTAYFRATRYSWGTNEIWGTFEKQNGCILLVQIQQQTKRMYDCFFINKQDEFTLFVQQ